MNTVLANFHFLQPWWLLLLLLWPPLWWWLVRVTKARQALTRLVDASLLPYLLGARGRRQRWPLALPLLAAVLATLALAGPTWQRLPQAEYSGNAAQVVALSLSRRMLARDVTPDRLARARYKVRELLAANADGENGLIAYAGEAFVVAPLTTDAHALVDLLNALAPNVMPVKGDAPAKAIALGVKLLRQAGVAKGSLVLVTDDANAAAVTAAHRAYAAGVRVSVLGVGTARGAPVTLPDGSLLKNAKGDIVMARRDDASLRAVAAAGGGRYQVMTADQADIRALATELRPRRAGGLLAGAQTDRWRDFGPWLLLPLLPLAALAFRRGWLLMLLFMLLPLWPVSGRAEGLSPGSVPVSSRSVAATPSGGDATPQDWRERFSALWLNANQRAMRALSEGHFKRAQQLARDPVLRGVAAYRAGDYAGAAKAFAAGSGSDAAYDRGNAQARQGHFEAAIEAYSQALKLNPHNADAAANRKAIEDWLRKQKKPPLSGRPDRSGQNTHKGQNKPGGPGGPGKPGSRKSPQNASQKSTAKSVGGKQSTPPPEQKPPASPSSSTSPAPSSSSASRPSPAAASSTRARPRTDTAPGAAAARQQQREAAKASKALKAEMNHQLGKKPSKPQPYALGSTPVSSSSVNQLPQSMEQELQRVPDDPGGLLRRKFELEYRQRNGGGQGVSQ